MSSDLPTLEDFLSRKTLPPICLNDFYIVMRDRFHMEHLLDFYLDVRHHEILWRRYVKTILKSGIISANDDLLNGLYYPIQNSQRQNTTHSSPPLSAASSSDSEAPIEKYTNIKSFIQAPLYVPPPSNLITERKGSADDISINIPIPIVRPATDKEGCTTISYGEYHKLPDRLDLCLSTERIIHTYLVPGGPKSLELILPDKIRQVVLNSFKNPNGTIHNDPILFTEAKHAAFLYMERWAFPPFLGLNLWGNITMEQCYYRLVFGLFLILIAFTMSLSFIFLNYPMWGIRFWSLLPFWIGSQQFATSLSGVDPFLILLFNMSETTTFHLNKISQPQAKTILKTKAMRIIFFGIVLSLCYTLIMCAIPPVRL